MFRRAGKTLVLLCLTVAGTMSAGEAKADPDSRDRAELLRTIRELTQRVRELEAQVRALSTGEGRVAAATPAADAGCSSPFFMGADGVRRVRLECLNQPASAESCENPFVLDATGIKRVKRACLTSMAAPSKPQ